MRFAAHLLIGVCLARMHRLAAQCISIYEICICILNVDGGFIEKVKGEINTLALRKRTPSFKRLDYTKRKESVVQEIKNRSEAYREPHKALMEEPTSRKLMILSNGRSGESRSKLDWGMVCTYYVHPYIYIREGKETKADRQKEEKEKKIRPVFNQSEETKTKLPNWRWRDLLLYTEQYFTY